MPSPTLLHSMLATRRHADAAQPFFLRMLLSFAALLSGALLLAGCGGEEEAPADPVRPVRTAEVTRVSGSQTRAFAGRTQAPIASQLSFRVGGTVTQRPVKVGQRLKAGALVAALDATDYQIQVQEAEAALAEAQSQVANAEAEYERVRGLYAEDLVSRSRFDQAQTQRQTSRARLEAAEQRLALAEQRLGYTRLYAPEAGAVADVRAEPGENVQAGQPVARLTTGGALEVEISVPEGLIARIAEGDSARVSLAAYTGRAFRAVVTEVGVSPGASSTAYPVVARLEEPPAEMRPGMAARVAFAFQDAPVHDAPVQEASREGPASAGSATAGSETVAVPSEAVGRDAEGQPFAFVVEPLPDSMKAARASGTAESEARAASTKPPDGIARRRTVEVGMMTPQSLEVRGLAAGERVVTAGVGQLTDGQPVRLTQPSLTQESERSSPGPGQVTPVAQQR